MFDCNKFVLQGENDQVSNQINHSSQHSTLLVPQKQKSRICTLSLNSNSSSTHNTVQPSPDQNHVECFYLNPTDSLDVQWPQD